MLTNAEYLGAEYPCPLLGGGSLGKAGAREVTNSGSVLAAGWQQESCKDSKVAISSGGGGCPLAGGGSGLWALDSGLWALGSGLWALGSGLWALGSGLWALGSGLWANSGARISSDFLEWWQQRAPS